MTDKTVSLPEEKSHGGFLKNNLRSYGMLLSLFVIMLFFQVMTDGTLLQPLNLTNLVLQNSYIVIMALGMLLIIVAGHIDLSVPWVMTMGAMMACAAAGFGDVGLFLAIPFGISCGALFGVVNGLGVAYLRIPSMIVTLATNVVAQGLMVLYTGGFSPQDSAPPAVRWLATGFIVPGLPNAVIVWAIVSAIMVFLYRRTAFGRSVYGIGNSERAAYLSGINTRRIVLIAFVVSGGLSAFAGVLVAGYASKAAQSMGDAYLLPSIAAVVLGGTSILGGRGSYLGTIAGVILITLLQSILAVMQMPEAGRQVIYGVVIIAMLLLYGRTPKTR